MKDLVQNPRRTRRLVLILLIYPLLLMAPRARTQENTLRFKHYSIDDGLSHSKVNYIYQDKRGYMWFGTNEGLNRFDGYQFTAYRYNPHGSGNLSANLVRCITEDHKGRLWIATEAGGLDIYDPKTDAFQAITPDIDSRIRISHADVNSVLIDSSETVWIGTNNGLDRLQGNTIQHFSPWPDGGSRDSRNQISILYEDRHHNLWVGTSNSGLMRFDRKTSSFSQELERINASSGLTCEGIRSIHEDRQGHLWIGTNNLGLGLYNPATQTFQFFQPAPHDPENKTIRAILDDGKGNLWLGNRAGLYIFDRKLHSFSLFRHNPNDPYSLSHNSVQHIFQDASGDVWIGTRDGINYLNMNQQAFIHYRAETRNTYCLNNNVVFAIYEDKAGEIWFGTEEGGLNRYNRSTGLFTFYRHETGRAASLRVNNIKALTGDSKDNLWIGTYQGGLNYFQRNHGTFSHFLHNDNDSFSIADNTVTGLCRDQDGDLWIAFEGLGLDCLARNSEIFLHAQPIQNNIMFQTVYVDHANRIWTNLGAGTLGCFNKASGQWARYRIYTSLYNDLAVNVIFQDRDGQMWIGTAGRGLYRLNAQNGQVQVFTREQGLPSEVIFGILQDDSGWLWLSTTNGLCRFHPATLQCRNYTKENGLQSNQFCYNAYCKSRDGNLWFGGIHGVTSFLPQNVHENLHAPPVVLTEFRLYNRKVTIGDPDGLLERPIDETEKITLSWRQSSFSFEFAALNFEVSSQNRYAYKLQNFDPDWNMIEGRRTATYTNLGPGRYQFQVIAANNDGVWNKSGAHIDIVILPPFWRQWWFTAALFLAAVFTALHFIAYYRQKRNLLKTTALAHLSQLKLLRYQMNPHFLFNALNSIRSMILIDRDRAWQMVTELSDFFRYALLNFNRFEASLHDEIEAVQNYLHIEKIRYRDTLQVEFKIDDQAGTCMVPAFIVQPLIENAIKYGMASSSMPLRVMVNISFTNRLLAIDVSNSGELVPPRAEATSEDRAHGRSLQNIRERLQLMFKDRADLDLATSDGWVHVRVRIIYPPQSESATRAFEELEEKQGREQRRS
jgi:ligand-binding sensor domain-containing protein